MPSPFPRGTPAVRFSKLLVPSTGGIFKHGDWGLFFPPQAPGCSPLWPLLKVVNMKSPPPAKRRGVFNAFWINWGVDARRWRHGSAQRQFGIQQPEVYAAMEQFCLDRLTADWAERRIGAEALAAARARLAEQSRIRAEMHEAAAMESKHAAALAEDARRSKPKRRRKRAMKFEDLL
jgi:hypothetical protein